MERTASSGQRPEPVDPDVSDYRVMARILIEGEKADDEYARAMTGLDLDLDAVKARADRAGDEVDRLCEPRKTEWRMSIPANPDRDSDLIIGDSLADIPALIAEVRRLRAEAPQ